jgi:hypothetical protein
MDTHLDLCVVIAGAECAQLRQAALLRACGDARGIRREHAAILLAVFLVLSPRVALAHRPVHAVLERVLQVLVGRRDDPLRPHADGNVVKQPLRELVLDGVHIGLAQVGAQQAHAAIDVKAHAAR